MMEIVHFRHRIEIAVPTGRCHVEAFSRLEFHHRYDNMHVHPATPFAMENGRPSVLIVLKPCKGHLFEIIQNRHYLFVRRPVFRSPCNDSGGIAVPEGQVVDESGIGFRIADQDPDFLPGCSPVITLSQQVIGRFLARATAMGQEPDQHFLLSLICCPCSCARYISILPR